MQEGALTKLCVNDDEFYDFCMANPDVRFERTAQGEIIIVPRVGGETAYRDTEVSCQLGIWAKRDGRGKAFGPSEFILPTGAAYSPDAAWVSNERLAPLTKEQKRKFLRLCPEFVVEVMSPATASRPHNRKCRTGWQTAFN